MYSGIKAREVYFQTRCGFWKIKVKQNKTPHVGTLHQSLDWILKADLDKKYKFPLHIAYTELWPDITIYSNLAKK